MKIRKVSTMIGLGVVVLLIAVCLQPAQAKDGLTAIESLGKALYFDQSLSANGTQSCASCHAPEVGFTGPDSVVNLSTVVYQGALPNHFGNRKPPTAAYGGDSPVMYFDENEGLWIGGMFWDGRATGWTLGDPLAEQAKGPFLNPVEQSLANAQVLCVKVSKAPYAVLFDKVWGTGSLDCKKNVQSVYDQIGYSISAYEHSAEVNPFTSKYDYYLAGKVKLTSLEKKGLKLFNGKAMCSLCHLSDGDRPLFTDFTYDNLGIPANPDNPFYTMPASINPDGFAWVDWGLGGFLKSAGFVPSVYEPELGKHKVPTLRNVDRRPYVGFVKAYGHNGYFKSLEEIVHFYNTRDVETWPLPEVPGTVNTTELGNLGLSAKEEAALVAFMKTLSDGFIP